MSTFSPYAKSFMDGAVWLLWLCGLADAVAAPQYRVMPTLGARSLTSTPKPQGNDMLQCSHVAIRSTEYLAVYHPKHHTQSG